MQGTFYFAVAVPLVNIMIAPPVPCVNTLCVLFKKLLLTEGTSGAIIKLKGGGLMFERIKYVRQNAKLTQTEFAEKIGLSRNFIAKVELGNREPSDRTIKDICRVFGCNEVWLRTGVGEPFAPKTRRDAIDEYIGQLSAGKRSDIEQLLIEVMAHTTVDEWKAIAEVFRKAKELYEKSDAD